MDKETKPNFESSWNSASALMFEIARLRTSANTFYTGGVYKGAINNLIAIQQTVCAILNVDELKELDEIEDDFFDTVIVLEAGDDTFDSKGQEWLTAKKKLLKTYNKYNRCIMRALQNHDLLLSSKVDTTIMQS